MFRNPDDLVRMRTNFIYTEEEYRSARDYILGLEARQISYTHPEHAHYPRHFMQMKEPPLFIEYRGQPLWLERTFLSVVGAREMHEITLRWMQKHLGEFCKKQSPDVFGIVSGGARGVDQMAHLTALKNNCPTLIVLPSGLEQIYPKSIRDWGDVFPPNLVCFMSEFECHQNIRKDNFYFRNRLIAALGEMTLVTQCAVKSGTFLTVHHSLENGKPVLSVPSHPEMSGFDGNLKLMQDGASVVSQSDDLLEFWLAESSSKSGLMRMV